MSHALLCGLLTLMQPMADSPAGVELQPTQLWGDRLHDESLRARAPDNEVVVDAETFAKLWKAWRPHEDVPAIDFEQSLVLVATTDGPNRMFASLRKSDGDVTTVYGSTKVGGPGFGYLIAVVPRDGIVSINGRPLETISQQPDGNDCDRNQSAGEYVRIHIRGTVETGRVAIGGETTGTVVRARGLTFELRIDDEELRAKADTFNGRTAVVTGDLGMQPGIETGPRWIIDVKSICPAKNADP